PGGAPNRSGSRPAAAAAERLGQPQHARHADVRLVLARAGHRRARASGLARRRGGDARERATGQTEGGRDQLASRSRPDRKTWPGRGRGGAARVPRLSGGERERDGHGERRGPMAGDASAERPRDDRERRRAELAPEDEPHGRGVSPGRGRGRHARDGGPDQEGWGPMSEAVVAPSLLSDGDLYLINDGTHTHLHEKLGAHAVDGGTYFAVWAPNAGQVSVVADWNGWDPRTDPLRPRASSGIWEGLVAEARPGSLYKFHIVSRDGAHR